MRELDEDYMATGKSVVEDRKGRMAVGAGSRGRRVLLAGIQSGESVGINLYGRCPTRAMSLIP